METKCKEVTKEFMAAIEASDKTLLIDSLDVNPIIVSEDKCIFQGSKFIDVTTGSNKGDRKPIGQLVYTITVEANFIPYDE